MPLRQLRPPHHDAVSIKFGLSPTSPGKQGKIKGPMLWVKRRGHLEDGGFQSKCNGPNGLSPKLTNIQSLESTNWTISQPREETQQLRGFARLHFNLLRVKRDGAWRQLAMSA